MRDKRGGSAKARRVPDGYIKVQLVLRSDEMLRHALLTVAEWDLLRERYSEGKESAVFVGKETVIPDIWDVVFMRKVGDA
jgi:hypothetical protein